MLTLVLGPPDVSQFQIQEQPSDPFLFVGQSRARIRLPAIGSRRLLGGHECAARIPRRPGALPGRRGDRLRGFPRRPTVM